MSTLPQEALIKTAAKLAREFKPSEQCSSGSVAAALITVLGNVYTGVCIDTACGLGFCAEHAAIAEMLKSREADIEMIGAVNSDEMILFPCGRCRELMWQVSKANTQTRIIVGPDRTLALNELLPYPSSN